jgi:hypothetical protein
MWPAGAIALIRTSPPILCRLIEALITACREMGCYKVILDCSESNAPFYEKCGLVRKEIQMVGIRAFSLSLSCPGGMRLPSL